MSETLGMFIKRSRKRHGMSRQQLAKELHVSEGTVKRLEEDDILIPGNNLLKAISEALGCSYERLLELRGKTGYAGIRLSVSPVKRTFLPTLETLLQQLFAE